jgi:hypothetical protein
MVRANWLTCPKYPMLDGSVVKERQRVVLGDNTDTDSFAGIDSLTGDLSVKDTNLAPTLNSINRRLGVLIVLMYK